MKTLLFFVFASLIYLGCKDKPEPNVAALLIGDWKLTQYKQENQAWRDSTGTFYNFINDTLVNTKIFNNSCDRKYLLNESSEGLKQVTFPVYQTNCFYPYWISINITAINTSQMEITYLDEVGGTMVKKYEKYVKN